MDNNNIIEPIQYSIEQVYNDRLGTAAVLYEYDSDDNLIAVNRQEKDLCLKISCLKAELNKLECTNLKEKQIEISNRIKAIKKEIKRNTLNLKQYYGNS